MAGRSRVMWKAIVGAALLSLVASAAAHAQSSLKKGGHGAPSTETKPKVDEKAYKAALDRIPTPKKPYDPWGQVHEPEPAAKPSGKSN
jgi:hypothetical protein